MVDVNYALVGSNGDTITFGYSDYVLNPEFTGFGIPPAQLRIEESAGDGGVYRHSKKGIRTIDMPITVLGTDRSDVQTKLRRLGRLIQDTSGPTILQANYSDGETLELTAYYAGGAESQWGTDAGLTWCRWVLTFQCPSPYWESNITEEFTVSAGITGRGLLPQLTKLQLTSSQVFGVITVDNDGDVPAYPIWTITGPISELEISNGTVGFSFNSTVNAGEIIIVDTKLGTVVDTADVNRYSLLDAAPKLFRIEPGETSITVNGTNATTASQVKLSYSPLYEVVH